MDFHVLFLFIPSVSLGLSLILSYLSLSFSPLSLSLYTLHVSWSLRRFPSSSCFVLPCQRLQFVMYIVLSSAKEYNKMTFQALDRLKGVLGNVCFGNSG